MPLVIRQPRLWNGRADPHLYSVLVEVSAGGDMYVFCVESEFLLQDGHTKVRGLFLLLPDAASLAAILRAIRMG